MFIPLKMVLIGIDPYPYRAFPLDVPSISEKRHFHTFSALIGIESFHRSQDYHWAHQHWWTAVITHQLSFSQDHQQIMFIHFPEKKTWWYFASQVRFSIIFSMSFPSFSIISHEFPLIFHHFPCLWVVNSLHPAMTSVKWRARISRKLRRSAP